MHSRWLRCDRAIACSDGRNTVTDNQKSGAGRTSGVWVCSPGRMLEEHHNEDEFCTIIAGKVGLIDNEDGTEEIFVAGDSFFLPKGSSLTWVVYETLRKLHDGRIAAEQDGGFDAQRFGYPQTELIFYRNRRYAR